MPKFLILFLVIIISSGCIASNKDKKNQNTIDQLEIQEDIQRFYTRFTERLTDITISNKEMVEKNKESILREYMLYDSEALKIATSPFPEINLLDMLVFIKLNKIVIREYWTPKVYGELGNSIYKAFDESEKDIEQLASKIMSRQRLLEIDELVQDWRNEHPNQVRVEKIRLADFSKFAKVDEGKKSSSLIIFVDTKSAIQAVDQMVLVANRGIFLAQHIPLQVRLQARLGAIEILSDTVNSLQSAPKIIGELNETEPLVNKMLGLTKELDLLARDTQSLISQIQKSYPQGIPVNHGLEQINSLLDKASTLMAQMQTQRPINQKTMHEFKIEFRYMILFLAFILILAGIIISAAWWTGSYLSKKRLARHQNV